MSPPSPFLRESVAPRLFQTVCLYCGSILGYSPNPKVLSMMEQAHRCPGLLRESQGETGDGAS